MYLGWVSALRRLFGPEGELVVRGVHSDALAVADFAAHQLLGERGFHSLLHVALEGPRAVHRVITCIANELAGRICKLKPDLAVFKPLAQPVDLKIHNAGNLVAPQGQKDHGFVHTVEELGAEVRP